jgi:hypothetical protein
VGSLWPVLLVLVLVTIGLILLREAFAVLVASA